jgi:hypothetical protein
METTHDRAALVAGALPTVGGASAYLRSFVSNMSVTVI